MKRTLKYWAIQMLGREFMALNHKQRVVGCWWVLSFCLLGSCCDTNPLWFIAALLANFVASSIAVKKLKIDE